MIKVRAKISGKRFSLFGLIASALIAVLSLQSFAAEVTYDFSGGSSDTSKMGFWAQDVWPPITVPDYASQTEMPSEAYSLMASSDASHFVSTATVSNMYAIHHFKFIIEEDTSTIDSIYVEWVGQGVDAGAPGNQYCQLRLWDYEFGDSNPALAYDYGVTREVTLSSAITSNYLRYIDTTTKRLDVFVVGGQESLGSSAEIRTNYIKLVISTSAAPGDTTSPAAVTDLASATGSNEGEIDLTWAAPGDDGWTGTLPVGSEYRVQYATYSTPVWEYQSAQIQQSTSGVTPGTLVGHTVTGLTAGATYYFKIWHADEMLNWSALSNSATSWAQEGAPTFDFVIRTDAASQNFAFRVYDAGNFEVVDWGTGSSSAPVTGTNLLLSYTYANAGDYTIKVRGEASGISFWGAGNGTPARLRDILTPVAPAVTGITSAQEMFRGATNISTFTATDFFDVASSSVTNMYGMFYGASAFNQDISSWSVSNVTNFADFLLAVTLSTANYNALLTKWSELPLKSTVTFGGGNSKYDLGVPSERRQHIISSFTWTITDGGNSGYWEETPSGLDGVALSTGSIRWDWNMTSGATHYYVYSSTGGTFLKDIVGKGTTGWIETGLMPNTTYARYVKAGAEAVLSAQSNTAVSSYTYANPPTGTFVSAVSSYSVTVQWSGNGNPAYTRWGILRSTDNFATSTTTLKQFADNLTGTSYTDSGLMSAATHWYKVRAFNENAIATAFDTTVSIMTLSPPAAPSGFAGAALTADSINWSWNDVGTEDGYKVKTDTGGLVAVLAADTTFYIETGLAVNTSYYRFVEAYNVSGSSASLANSVYTFAVVPDEPSFSAVHYTSATISWTLSNPEGTEYSAECSTASDFSVSEQSSGWITSISWSAESLSDDTTYYFRVKARNGDSYETDFSVSASTVTLYIDDVVPTVGITVPADGMFYNSLSEIQGTAADDVEVSTVSIKFYRWMWNDYWTGSTWLAAETWVGANNLWTSSWTYTNIPNLVSGSSYTVVAKAQDTAGNWSSVYSTVTFTYDDVLPESGITSPAQSGYYVSVEEIKGTSYDASGIEEVKLRVQREDGKYYTGALWETSAFWLSVAADDGTFGGTSENWTYSVTYPTEAWKSTGTYIASSRARDIAGNFETVTSSVTFQLVFSTPNAPSVFAGEAQSAAMIKWSWDDVATEDGYRVNTSTGDLLAELTANATSWLETAGLTANTSYQRYVEAYNASGSSASAVTSKYTLANSHSGLWFTGITGSSMTFAWSPNNPSYTKWGIYRSTDGFITSTETLKDFGAAYTDASYTDATVSNLTEYWYKVCAFNEEGIASSFNNVISTTTLDDTPPTVGITIPLDGAYYRALTQIEGTAEDQGAVLDVQISIQSTPPTGNYWDGVTFSSALSTWVAASAVYVSSWTYSDTPFPTWVDGSSYTVIVKAVDDSDNWTTVYATSTFTYDVTAPASAVSFPVENGQYIELVSVEGTASDISGIAGVMVKIYAQSGANAGYYWNGSVWGAGGWLDATGAESWSYSTLPAWSTGTYSIWSIALDGALPSANWEEPVSSRTFEIVFSTPAAPSGFAGAALTADSINWSWNDVGTEDGYKLMTGTGGLVAVLAADTTFYIETGLAVNTSYYRFVEAYNVGGSSGSAGFSRYTLSNPPTGTYVSSVSSVSVLLAWSPNANPSYTSWGVMLSTDNFASSSVTLKQYSDTWTDTYYEASGLEPGSTYWFRVQAFNVEAFSTDFDNIIATRTIAVEVAISTPSAPTVFSGAAQSATSIMWTWTDNSSDEDGFYLKNSSDVVTQTLSANTTFYLETGFAVNEQVFRYAAAYNAAGESDSIPAAVYTMAKPPSVFTVTASSTSVMLDWSANGNPEGTEYDIEWSTTSDFAVKDYDIAPDTSYEISSLTSGVTYYIRVCALNGDGYSTAYYETSAYTAEPDVTAPSAVTAFTAETVNMKGAVKLSWTNPGDDGAIGTIFGGAQMIRYITGASVTTLPDIVKDIMPGTTDTLTITGLVPGGAYTFYIKVKDASGNISEEVSAAASAGAQPALAVSGITSPITAGVSSNFTVTAKNALGETNTGYKGSITFESKIMDGSYDGFNAMVSLPADYSFTSADAGSRIFAAAFLEKGELYNCYVRATDKSDVLITGQQVVTVSPLDFISGVVTQKDGTPVTGVYVEAYGIGLSTGVPFTTVNGSYTIIGLDVGTYTVRATWTGADGLESSAEKQASNGTASFNFTLGVNFDLVVVQGAVSGVSASAIRSASGLIMPQSVSDRAFVEIRAGKKVMRIALNDDGSFRLGNLLPGRYSARAWDGSRYSNSENLHLSGGAQATVRFTFPVSAEVYCWPNPFVALKTNETGVRIVYMDSGSSYNADLKIYTLTGELVRKSRDFSVFTRSDLQTGYQFVWDLRNNSRQDVASGVYFYTLDLTDSISGERKQYKGKIGVVR